MSTHANNTTKKAPQVYNGVSEADVPSAKLGWSELSSGSIQLAGWISVLFLVAYNFGNHQGHVETIWLVTIAALIALGLILFAVRPKLSQQRTLTAHNKPVGHQEPDWAYNQQTLSGPYAELDDDQLRALNIDPASVSHLRSTGHADDNGGEPVSVRRPAGDRALSTGARDANAADEFDVERKVTVIEAADVDTIDAPAARTPNYRGRKK